MDPRLARLLLAVALLAGLAADLLFDRVGPGINVTIATAAGLVAAWWFRPRPGRVDRLDWWIPPVTLAAAAGVAVRSDVVLVGANLLLAATGLVAWALAVSMGGLTRRSVAAVVAFGVEAGLFVGIAAGFAVSRAMADRPKARGAGRLRRLLPVLRGLLIAGPVLLVFAGLLGSADAAFARLLDRLLDLGDVDEAARRLAFALAMAWPIAGGLMVAAGGLTGAFHRPQPTATVPGWGPPTTSDAGEADPAPEPRAGGLGATEALTVLVAVELLFVAFLVVQVGYLFGGFDTVTRSGMTYSDYARQGFFQLVAVVAGAGLLLLTAQAMAGASRRFVPVALGLVALTSLVLVSAAVRLGLYQQAYGWTELRFHVVAAIAWFALDLGLAAVLLVLRRTAYLVHAVTLAGIAVLLGVTLLGPSAFIARQNVARALDASLVPPGGRPGLDADYVLFLGDGAVPILVEALPRLDPGDRDTILRGLLLRRDMLEEHGPLLEPLAWKLEREAATAALRTLPGAPAVR